MNKTHCGKLGTLNALFGRLELSMQGVGPKGHTLVPLDVGCGLSPEDRPHKGSLPTTEASNHLGQAGFTPSAVPCTG